VIPIGLCLAGGAMLAKGMVDMTYGKNKKEGF
jgi:hypothetical protein